MQCRAHTLLIVLSVLARGSLAQESQHPTMPQIVTSAEGVAHVKPDRASIDIGVQTRAATAAEASSLNALKQSAIINAIRARGVAIEDITTTNYSVSPELRYREGESPQVTGFVVSNDVQVIVRSLANTGRVLDAALAAGANQINSLSFTVASPDSARRAALASAVASARADAEVMAKAARGTLGALLELTSVEISPPVPRPVMALSRSATAEAATPIEAGQEDIRASVTARWQFIPTP